MNRRHALATLLGTLAGTPLARGESLIPELRNADGWQLASTTPQLTFPRDHYYHADFQIEWWYFTGHLQAAARRRFGFQLTFFRIGLRPSQAPEVKSTFLSDSLPFAHFAISDPKNKQIHTASLMKRAAFGEAGFSEAGKGTPRIAWIDDWELSQLGSTRFRAQAFAETHSLELAMQVAPQRSKHPWVFHGENGLSRKTLGNAHNSIYYACPRMKAEGKMRLGEDEFEVKGNAWLDREWSSQLVGQEIAGWDWISLNLDDGRDLMVFQLRDQQGQRLPGGHGTLVEVDGRSRILTAPEFSLTPLESWTSPETQGVYPIRWSLEIPNERIQCLITSEFDAQEVNHPPAIYWEGMVRARGRTTGKGYLEMTGYAPQDQTMNRLRGM